MEQLMSERPVAVVTGAGTGVGAACAAWFALRGYNVLINYRGSEAAANLVASQCRDAGVEGLAVQGDVAVDADCRRIALIANEQFGRIDVLVNSAGTTLFRSMSDLEA